MADKIRKVPGMGDVAFPDDMPDDEIQKVVDEHTPGMLDHQESDNPILAGAKGVGRSLYGVPRSLYDAYHSTDVMPTSPDELADKSIGERASIGFQSAPPVRLIKAIGHMGKGIYDSSVHSQELADRAAREQRPGESLFHSVAAAVPFAGSIAEKAYASAQKGDNVGAATEGITDALLMKGVEDFPEASRAVSEGVGGGLKNAGEFMYNKALKTKGKHEAFGGRPGRGVAQERIFAASKRSLLDKIENKIPERAAQAQDILDLPQNAAKRVDIRDAVHGPFDEAITSGEAGVAPDATLNRLEQTKNELTLSRSRDAEGNRVFGEEKPLSEMTPAEANAYKQDVYERTNYRNPENDEAVNSNLRTAARNVKLKVNEAVPDVVPVNQRVQDLITARDAMGGHLKNKLIADTGLGVRDLPAMAAGATLGHPLFGVGAADVMGSTAFKTGLGKALYSAGDFLHADPALPTPGPIFTQGQIPASTTHAFPESWPEPEYMPPDVPSRAEEGAFGGRPAGPGIPVGEKFDARGSGIRGELPAGPQEPLMLSAPPTELGIPASPEPKMNVAPARRVVVRDPRTGRMRTQFVTDTAEEIPFQGTSPEGTLIQQIEGGPPQDPRRRR